MAIIFKLCKNYNVPKLVNIMLKINLNKTKFVSINDAYYVRNKNYNAKARKYREKFFSCLSLDSNQKYLASIREEFDPKLHFLAVKYTFLLPKDVLFTKKNTVSIRSMDIDNLLKLPTDFLCNKKYINNDDYPCSNLEIDDKFILSNESHQRPSMDDNYCLFIEIQVKPLKDLFI